jgi:hypothetical protein
MEQFNLNTIPGKVAPVCHASQYDVGRIIRVNLFAGDQVYTLDGTEVVSISVRKPDGHVVTEGITNTSAAYVEIVTTEQMTACPGANLCELKIEKGANVLGTLNFILSVEEDPLAGGDQSDSFVYNLAVQIAQGVALEVANQYDSANVIFDTTPTAGHGLGYAVTSEGVKNATDAQIFNRADVLLNTMGGTLRGFGAATVYMKNGIARIDFNIKISVDETTPNIGTWGINRDYFTPLTGKTIQPLEGGVATYYRNEQVFANRVDFGGTFLVSGQFWRPARVYDDNGTKKVGAWFSNSFASGDRFVGTCYGSYT